MNPRREHSTWLGVRSDVVSFIAAGVLLVIAVTYWLGILPNRLDWIWGGFGTLFVIVSAITAITGVIRHRRIRSSGDSRRGS